MGARSESWATLAAVLATATLLAGGVALWVVLRLAFPYGPPLPAPGGGPARPGAGSRRVGLLERLGSAALIDVPNLDEAYLQAKAYGRGTPLLLPGVSGDLKKIPVAMPLVLDPDSAAEVDHEVRHALYLPAPARVRWRVRLPDEARLVFGAACLPVPGSTPGGVVRVIVRSMASGRSLVGEVRVGAPSGPGIPSPWTDKTVDLSPLSGEEVLLELQTLALEPAPGRFAHVLVANPDLVGGAVGQGHPNLLWINIDTVQAKATGVGGARLPTTPNLDRLARQGVTFTRAYAAANWTRPSNQAFMTGRYPSELGTKPGMIPTLPEERRSFYLWGFPTLPDHLARQGYLTRAVVQNNLLEDVWGTGPDIGFREYRYVKEDLHHSEAITREAIRFMERHAGDRWFLYLGYNAPHWPYRPTRQALRRIGFAALGIDDWLYGLYLGEVAFSDQYIGPLIQTLVDLGLARDTLVVINSDHGEQLSREHEQEIVRASLWEADTPTRLRTRPGHEGMYDETTRVPWVMWWPGRIPAGVRVDVATCGYDIPPTILDLMGLPPMPGRGRSMVPAIMGRSMPQIPLLIEGKSIWAVVHWPYKYIRRPEGYDLVRSIEGGGGMIRVPEELYDLEADPGEVHDLAGRLPEVLDTMRHTWAVMLPEPRYLYILEATNQGAGDDLPGRFLIEISPMPGAIHLMDEEEVDSISCDGGGCRILLDVPPWDRDRVGFRAATARTRFTVQVRDADGDGTQWSEPWLLGRWCLPAGGPELTAGDRVGPTLLDSDRDPGCEGSGIRMWRLPVVGGIPGRGGELDEAVQETFRGWGYVK